MSEAQVFTATAAKKGKVELPAEFSGEVNTATLHAVIRAHLGNQRQGTHSTKTRSEVSGGGRKPFKQKGTGRARQGTTRAAHMRGGGIVFGPKPRNYRIELPKKVRRNALVSALSARAGEGAVHVIESFGIDQPKTKDLVKLLHGIGLADSKVLILTDGPNPPVFWSARNLPGVHVMRYQDANAYDVLWCSALVVEKAALTESVKEVAGDA